MNTSEVDGVLVWTKKEAGPLAGRPAGRPPSRRAERESWTCCSWSGVSEMRSCPARAAMSAGEADAVPAPPVMVRAAAIATIPLRARTRWRPSPVVVVLGTTCTPVGVEGGSCWAGACSRVRHRCVHGGRAHGSRHGPFGPPPGRVGRQMAQRSVVPAHQRRHAPRRPGAPQASGPPVFGRMPSDPALNHRRPVAGRAPRGPRDDRRRRPLGGRRRRCGRVGGVRSG